MTGLDSMDHTIGNKPKKPASGRRYGLLAFVIFLVIGGWSAFWYLSYQKTSALVDRLTSRVVDGKPMLVCNDRYLGGYPFRLLLSCSSYALNDPRSGWQIEGGPIRAIWQVYAPNLAVLEGDNRLLASHIPSNQTYDLTATLMRASVRLSPNDYVTRASFTASDAIILSNNALINRFIGTIKAKVLEFHARPTPDRTSDLDLAITGEDLSIGQWPMVTGTTSFTIPQGLDPAIRTAPDPTLYWLANAGKLEALTARLEIGQKTLSLDGDILFDRTGYANGDLTLKILNPKPEDATPAKSLTAKRDGLNGPLTALQLMGKPVSEDNMVGSAVKLNLSSGKLRAGILPLGQIPSILQ